MHFEKRFASRGSMSAFGTALLLLIAATSASHAAECVDIKLKAAATLSRALTNCYVKWRDRLFEPTCYQRAQAKFDASFAKAQAAGACAGNAAAMKQAVIDSVTQLVFETTTDSCVFALDGSHSCLVNPNVPACEAACTLVVADTTTLPRYDCWCAVGP